ncbi:hypothetical protein H9L39_16657, partial [Fusarium oxysporum f. sp. albedinis]
LFSRPPSSTLSFDKLVFRFHSHTAKMGIDDFSYNLGNVAAVKAHKAPVTVKIEPNLARSPNGYTDRDQLARLGNQQGLKGLNNGNTLSVIYSFLIIWVSNFSVFPTTCKLASIALISTRQYYWVAMMALQSCAEFLSYLIGMLTVSGWQGSIASIFWSFACNCSLPFWCTLSKVNERITVPVWAIPATTTISVLLSPINARSPIAFITAASLLISCLYASYLIAAILLLHCRTTKGFILILSLDLLALANTTGTKLIEGLFYLLGASYIANNIFSIYYLTVISFFNF